MKMNRRTRLILFCLGLALVCLALAALAYVWWPTPTLQAQATLAPTLFAPP
jgi:hypothetical protein